MKEGIIGRIWLSRPILAEDFSILLFRRFARWRLYRNHYVTVH